MMAFGKDICAPLSSDSMNASAVAGNFTEWHESMTRPRYQMQCSFTTGYLILEWPQNITPKQLDCVEKVIALQLTVARQIAEELEAERDAKAQVFDV